MPTDVVMPQMGESIAEGTIVRWIKKVGDAVDRDEPLFEISTDKVDAEIPSPAAGVLLEIRSRKARPCRSTASSRDRRGRAKPAATPPRCGRRRRCRGRRSRRDRRPTARPHGAGGRSGRTPPGDWRRAAAEPRPTATRRSAAAAVVAARAEDRQGARRRHRADCTAPGIGGRVTKHDILAFIETGDAGAAAATPRGRGGRRRRAGRAGVSAGRARSQSSR